MGEIASVYKPLLPLLVRVFSGEVPSPDLFIKVMFLGEVVSSPAGSETEKGVYDKT